MTQVKTTDEFAGLVVADVAAAISGVLTNIGHKKGLYKAMAGVGDMRSNDLASKTNTDERYVREWLNNQTAGGYIHYNPKTDTYYLPDNYIPVLADEESPFFLVPALEVAASLWLDEGKIMDIFESGDGLEWGEHHHRLYYGVSTVICTPCSKSQEVGLALGAQAGEKRLSDVMKEAGFSSIERVAETPFNIILAAKV